MYFDIDIWSSSLFLFFKNFIIMDDISLYMYHVYYVEQEKE